MATNTKFTLTINVSPAVVALLMAYQQSWDKRHTLEYIAEDCILTGVTAKDRSKRYSEETANARGFQAAIAANPSVVTDPVRMAELARKFKIGASKGGSTSQSLVESARGLIAEAEAEISEAELEKMTAPAGADTNESKVA